MIWEAARSGIRLRELYVTSEFAMGKEGSALIAEARCRTFLLSPGLMKKVSALETPPGILGLAEPLSFLKVRVLRHFGACLFSIRDPGNFGAMIRAAEAASCEMIAYTGDCVDPNTGKVIRASMGSIFRVPLLEVEDGIEYLNGLSQKGIRLYALDPQARASLFEMVPRFPAIILIGSEAHGLPKDLPAVERITIPMSGKVESLNAAMAAAVCFYHFRRMKDEEE